MPRLNLDDYALGEVLGIGSAGTIYEATDRHTGQKVAVKRLHPTVSRDPLIGARFRREMGILEKLSHPNIVGYFGGGEDAEGNLFYVMEFVDGGSVRDLLASRSSGLDWKIVVSAAVQICSALQCAHNNGIIHRDLKPGNLFLTRDASIKLGDFGIARDVRSKELTDTGLTVGTHAYMAPEQIMGAASISGKADLYALGCCLHEMLTGQKPYIAENFPQLFEMHLRAQPPRPSLLAPNCPPELDAIVTQLMAKKPEDRPFNAREVQGRMFQIMDQYKLRGQPQPPGSTQAEVKKDISAEKVGDVGRNMLRDSIDDSLRRMATPEFSARRFLIAIVVLAIAALAFYLVAKS